MSHFTEQQVYVGLGANLGDSLFNLQQAVNRIQDVPGIRRVKVSHFYQTNPWSGPHQPSFINAVCSFTTTDGPASLLHKMQAIEQALGKVPKPKDAPRPIDIDILFYGSSFYTDLNLEIPHPLWQQRLFVLIPLADLTAEVEIVKQEQTQKFILKDLIEEVQVKFPQVVSLLEKTL
jgi:2-amino-4-hydroxy-6-hydroxymethyldihydropteridine diphosphokinase